ncbi:MAG TPA: hypothetical protein VFO62_00675, partial [Candidatus Binatia bacterium]|nr:hypothetical protein [Candidatus Binatia bacterium]
MSEARSWTFEDDSPPSVPDPKASSALLPMGAPSAADVHVADSRLVAHAMPAVAAPSSATDMPFDIWARDAVPWGSGDFVAHIIRLQPERHHFANINRTVPVRGPVATFHVAPTLSDVARSCGGGSQMKCIITGPDRSGRQTGKDVVVASFDFSLPGEPKLPDAGVSGIDLPSSGGDVSASTVQEALRVLQRSTDGARSDADVARAREEAATREATRVRENASLTALEVVQRTADSTMETLRKQLEASVARSDRLEQELRGLMNSKPGAASEAGALLSPLADVIRAMAPQQKPSDTEGIRDTIRELSERHSRELSDLHARHAAESAAAREQHSRDLDWQRKTAEESRQALEREHQRAIESMRAEAGRLAEEHRQRLSSERDEYDRRAQRERSDLEMRHRSDMERAVSQVQAAAAIEKAAYESRLASAESERDRYRIEASEMRSRADQATAAAMEWQMKYQSA